MTNWFRNMGYDQFDDSYYQGERRRDNFDSFIRKMVRDTLTLDAVVFEKQLNQRGVPHAIWPIDPSTIKYAAEKWVDAGDGTMKPTQPETTNGMPVRYVQELYNGHRVAVFNERELSYTVRNPRTDLEFNGYGLSELEILAETVTQILFTEQYNAKYFTQNALPQGVLTIAGKYTPEAIESFKRQWVAQVSGVNNAWRIPIMAIDEAAGGVDFKPFKESNRNMQYNLWLEYLIQTACSVYTIDPSEIGYAIKGAGGGPMVEHSGATKFDFSKDKGLRPLLKFFAHIFNEQIVQEIYPDLFFEWVGIDSMSEKDKIELVTKKLQNGMLTVNEVRALSDEEAIDENWANAPASPALLQVYMADLNYQREQEKAQEEKAQAQMAATQPVQLGPDGQPLPTPGQPGQPGAEGGAPPNPGAQPGGELSVKPGAQQDIRTATGKDNGVDMPIPETAHKDETTGTFQDARAEEKKMGERRRERHNEGETGVVTKSFEDGDVIEFTID
jgi:hypothetical protein